MDPDSSLTELTSPHQYFCFDAGSLGFYYGYDNIPKHLSQLLFLAPSQIWRKKMFSVKASTFPAFPQVATGPGLPSDLNSFPSSRHHIVETVCLPHRSVSLRLLLGLRKTESIPRLTHPLFHFTRGGAQLESLILILTYGEICVASNRDFD